MEMHCGKESRVQKRGVRHRGGGGVTTLACTAREGLAERPGAGHRLSEDAAAQGRRVYQSAEETFRGRDVPPMHELRRKAA
eukprot:364991-Chlamydomonas_euryale.AAC.6